MIKYVVFFDEYFMNIFVQELISCRQEYEELCKLDHVMNIIGKHKTSYEPKKLFFKLFETRICYGG